MRLKHIVLRILDLNIKKVGQRLSIVRRVIGCLILKIITLKMTIVALRQLGKIHLIIDSLNLLLDH